jgi:aerobic carbon-monoxide dehydrogenase medium subunit
MPSDDLFSVLCSLFCKSEEHDMIPSQFQYFSPATVDEAVGLLQQHGDEAKVLAGGHSLLPAMKLRLAQPGVLVDIGKIDGLKRILIDRGSNLRIGAMVTYHEIETSADVRESWGVLAECAGLIGDIQVRNRGTIGGSLAHADPASDLPALVLALGATITAQGPSGERQIAADDLFVDMLTTALEPTELITRVSFRHPEGREGAAYEKLRHPASRYAIVGVAAYVRLDGDGKVATARVAVTGAGPKATRQPAAEAALADSAGDADAIAAASEKAGQDMDFLGDIHASEEYRRAMVKVYARRAITKAVERARG